MAVFPLQAQGDFHTPAEILSIMENSEIIYEINPDSIVPSDQAVSIPDYQAFYQIQDSTGIGIHEFTITDSLIALMHIAEAAISEGKFDRAFKYYFYITEYDSAYTKVYSWIGNSHYILKQYDSAEYYFKKALRLNPIDCHAHWFLADTYFNLGAIEKARQHIIRAHLYNYSHINIKSRMKEICASALTPWQTWSFEPHYQITYDDGVVKIYYEPEWLAYAMVKAVWQYEPGYAKSMVGDEYDGDYLLNSKEEIESLLAYIAQNDSLTLYADILLNGYADEFIYYEIWAKKYPTILLTLPEYKINRIIEYLEKYH